MSLDVTTQFAEQVTVNQLVQNVVYASGAYAVSVTMADTGVGIAFNNYGAAWAGGAITGAIIAYKKGRLDYFTMGPMAGYVSGATGLDKVYWGIEPDIEPLAETSSSESGSAT